MEDLIKAIVLGIIQGLTEFLPVSSSGHLELAKFFLNDDSIAEQSMLMTVVLHFATALSTIIVFRKDVSSILKGLFKPFKSGKLALNDDWIFSLKIILSMIPAVIVGLVFEEQIEALFNQKIFLVGLMLVVTGLLLFLADWSEDTGKRVGWWDALIIGIAQAIAILPGISRSGATISTSVLLGVDRTRAARFSFLMVVPLIFGKIAKDILDGALIETSVQFLPLIVGFIAAFLTGLVACTWMIQLVKRSKLSWFSYYCFAVAGLALYLS